MAAVTDDRLPEVWLPIPGYERTYEASNLGFVRRLGKSQPLVGVDRGQGYPCVSLSQDGKSNLLPVHRLVLMAFCGVEPFPGAQAAHNDGDRRNPRLSNLRWATPSENQLDRVRHGTACRGEDVFGAVLTETKVRSIRQRIHGGERNRPIAEEFGVSTSTIHLIRHNRIWRHVA